MSIYPVKLIEWFPMTDELTHIARTVVEYSSVSPVVVVE